MSNETTIQETLQPDSICPFCAAPVYGSLTSWRCAGGHRSDGTTILLAHTAGVEAHKVDDFTVAVSYSCGHTAIFVRSDDEPMRPSDVGELLLSNCATCAEEGLDAWIG